MNQPVPDELISAYFDGEVTPDERQRIEALLESSIEVRQLLDDTSKLSALLHSFPREAAPSYLSKNVERQIATIVLPPSPPLVPTGRSLRREWLAFGAGMTATVASLVLWISLNPLGNRSQDVKVAQSPAMRAWPLNESTASNSAKDGYMMRDNRGFSEQNHASDQAVADVASAFSGKSAVAPGSLPVLPAPVPAEQQLFVALEKEQLASEDMKLPQDPDEFLRSLRNGLVIEQRIRDPNNAVMVVELTVVDVNKGVDGLQLLLEKRNLRPVDDSGAGAIAAKDKSAIAAGGLAVLYVRASGVELSEMLAALVKDQPDLYRGLLPRLPMEFPADVIADLMNVADKHEKSSTTASRDEAQVKTAATDQRTAVEANLVVQNFAYSNGMAIDQSAKGNAELLKSMHSSSARFGKSPVGRFGGSSHDADQSPRSPTMKQSPAQVDRESGKPLFDQARQAKAQGSQGYVSFRLGIDQQRQQTDQPAQAIESLERKAQDSPRIENAAVPAIPQQQNSPRSDLEDRDSGLMRMLIVVKPE